MQRTGTSCTEKEKLMKAEHIKEEFIKKEWISRMWKEIFPDYEKNNAL